MISCIGNHEVVGGYHAKRSDSPAVSERVRRPVPRADVQRARHRRLLEPGAARYESHRAGRRRADRWLEKTLAERQERPHLIVANHVPAYPSYRDPDPHDGAARHRRGAAQTLVPALRKVQGRRRARAPRPHLQADAPAHRRHIDKNGVLYLGDGSWGKLRVPHTPENGPTWRRSPRRIT